ncbi:aCPSF2 family 5'-3' exoribonuclease [Candidatus Mancarchaeum acidiphilum]|uniref:ACPSF2 family 5'-3' exoribonuclease n=1 Tax=Candidatus Mancarchaeum acidiphilum TaxID=1920749 RepID=A0A218NNY7_9ARCH|nr:MBL fold metallo-hydrolase [Candidatus Mancarchaeum acidiphilum]ASI14198.1 aCPSF2 family 5'-3' exoribonuclease [Candidatus Mancarchaeum acidiphilum]
MNIRILGAGQEVGRSAIMIEGEKKLMLDYGVKLENNVPELPVAMPNVDGIVLSHAHLDHSGAVPTYYRNKRVPTYGTSSTLSLIDLLLEDTIKIAKKEHTMPIFSKKDLGKMSNNYVNLPYHRKIDINPWKLKFYDAGHISGSAISEIERPKAKSYNKIVYTGDFKLQPQLLHYGAEMVKSDVLIIESTYANRDHPDREELISKFIAEVKETIESGGTALVPAFAVGRGQELLTMLYKNGLADVTYVDGMIRKATHLVTEGEERIKDAALLDKAIAKSSWIEEAKDRNEALSTPSVILTTAGMLTGGPVLNYIQHLNKKSKIFLTGYQVEGTNGRMLIDQKKIILDGELKDISTPVSVYDFSAHSGKTDLYNYVRESAPNVVVCVHGSEENTKLFAETLRGEGFEAYAPKVGDKIELKD